MARRHRWISAVVALAVPAVLVVSVGTQGRGQQPPRDTSAQRPEQTATGKGRIAGRVLASDNGRPVRRARVFVNGAELPGGRGVLTDDNGSFEFTGLPAGRYSVTVSKTGFISLSYGQRRPLQAGTPLQLGDAQQLSGIDFSLPRGSVIAGHVFDETGEPLPGANVQVMRYQYAQGNRQLVPAGGSQTDDQGSFRVWGLNPGDYYVSAVSRSFDFGRGLPPQAAAAAVGRAGFPAGPPGRGGRGAAVLSGADGPDAQALADAARAALSALQGSLDSEPSAYAPTFYPGVASVTDARPVTVGLSAEVSDINFGLLLVRTARIEGRMTNADGSPAFGMVNLTPDTGQTGRRGPGSNYGSRAQRDGSFSIGNVPPGRYILRARGGSNDAPEFASQPVVVADGDISNLIVVLEPGATVAGTVTFQGTQSASVPAANQIRIAAPTVDASNDFINIGPNTNARVDQQGTFTIDGLPAGLHLIRPQGTPRGWTLKSVQIGGREMIDTPFEVRSGQRLSGVSLIFSDKISEVNGTVTDDRGTPITEYTVLAFPTDSTFWRPQARQIMTARPDQNGKFQIRGLPAGEYFMATIDPAEQGEWFDPAFLDQHRSGAVRVLLSEGDVKTQDFKLSQR